ncbi:hypothetical protein N2152v2_005220 [Parachlorella kessleri]
MAALGAYAASLLVLVASILPPSLAQQQAAMAYSPAPGSEPGQAAFLGEVWAAFPEAIEPSATAAMSCGLPSVLSYFTIHIAAMNLTAHPGACGRCIHLSCADRVEKCNGTSQGVTVAVVHDCPHCGAGDVQVNTFAFRELTNMEPGSIPAALAHWSFVPCGVFVPIPSLGEDRSLLPPANEGIYFQDVVVPAAGPGTEPLAARQPAGVGALPGRPPSVEAFIAQLPSATPPPPLPSLIELPQRAMDLPPAAEFPGDGGERGPAPEVLQAPGAVQNLMQAGRSTAASIVSDGGTRGAVGAGGAASTDPGNAPASPALPVVVGLGQVNAVGSRPGGALGVSAPGPELLAPSLESALLPGLASPSPPGLPVQPALLPAPPPPSPSLPPALLAMVTPPAAEIGLPVLSQPGLPPTPEGSLIPQLSSITAGFGGPPAAEAAAAVAPSPAPPSPLARPSPTVGPEQAAPRPELAAAAAAPAAAAPAATAAAPRPEVPTGFLPAAAPAAEVAPPVSLPTPALESAGLVTAPAAELVAGAPTLPVLVLPPSPEVPPTPPVVVPPLSPSPSAEAAPLPAVIIPALTPPAPELVPPVAPPAAEAAPPTAEVVPTVQAAPAIEAAPANMSQPAIEAVPAAEGAPANISQLANETVPAAEAVLPSITQPANETVPAAEGAPVVPQAPPSPELAPAVEAVAVPIAVPSVEVTGPGPAAEVPAGAAAAAAPAPSPEAAVPAVPVPPPAASPGRPSAQPLTLFEERFFNLSPAPLVAAPSSPTSPPVPAPAPAAVIVPVPAGLVPAPEGVVLPPAAEALLPPRTLPALQQPSPTVEQAPLLQPTPTPEQAQAPALPATRAPGAQAAAPAGELAPARAGAAPTAEGAVAGETFMGLATVGYSEPLTADKAQSLACSLGFLGSYAQEHFVGLDLFEVEDGLACGRCIRMTGSDNRLVVAHVVDSCWGCAPEDVRISPTVYRELTGQNASGQASTDVTYTFVPCAQTVSGPIYMHVIPGGNQYYQQLTFANSAQPLERVTANGQKLSYTDFHRWVWFNGGNPLNSSTGPIHLTLTSQNGTTLSTTTPGLYSQQLPAGAQFPGATPTASPAPPPCTDTPPDSRYTCEQQKGWGKCDAGFMLAGNHCAATCGRCGGGTVAAG